MNKLKKASALMVIAMLMLIPVVGLSYAQDDDDDDDESIETTTVEQTNETGSQADRRAEQEARKLERQQAVEAVIDQVRQTRVSQRCAAAQGKISAAVTRADSLEQNRTTIYNTVSTKLSGLVDRLNAAEVDTTVLAEQVTAYDSVVAEFFALLDNYQLALSDAAGIDCEEDTEGFILALDDARKLREQLKTKAQEIRSWVRDTIVPTLMDIKDSLSQDSSDQGEGDESTDGEES